MAPGGERSQPRLTWRELPPRSRAGRALWWEAERDVQAERKEGVAGERRMPSGRPPSETAAAAQTPRAEEPF